MLAKYWTKPTVTGTASESHESYVHRSLMSLSQCFREEMKTLNKHYKIDEQKNIFTIFFFVKGNGLPIGITPSFFGSVPLGRHWHNAIKVQKWKTVLIFTSVGRFSMGRLIVVIARQFLNCTTYYSSRNRHVFEMAVLDPGIESSLAVCLSTTVMISCY